jgi:multidrug efflux system membrane fusion protein
MGRQKVSQLRPISRGNNYLQNPKPRKQPVYNQPLGCWMGDEVPVRMLPGIRFPRTSGLVLLLGLAAFFRFASISHPERTDPKDEALAVDVIAARVQPMPVLLQAVGQVVSQHTVQVRPQISGMLKHVFFNEGQAVSTGQRLFQIEPAAFEAALASARAAAENARGNADRLEAIVKRGYVTQQDYRNVRALADQAEAAYKQAQINLSYADVRAPISGRTGSLTVKSGNIVSPTDTAQLVVINEMQPIEVQFSIPQEFLARVRRYQTRPGIKVSISGDKGAGNLDEGVLVFIDNAVNTNTGTVTLKARFPNEHEQLWPGQYVDVSMQLTVEPKAVVVPQTAIQTGQSGNYVYIMVQGKAQATSVKVDRRVGDLAVLSAGLAGDEQVILKVPRGLRSGMKISPAAGGTLPPAEVTLPKS